MTKDVSEQLLDSSISTIFLDQVIVKEARWRKEFDEKELQDLADSIDTLGLLHAPVVEQDKRTIVAGERRFRAINLLAIQGKRIRYNGRWISTGKMPVILMDNLSPWTYKEAELDENIKRVDLSWQEQAHATNDLHQMRKEQASEKGEEHTRKDTALELAGRTNRKAVDRSYHEVREDLIVAAYLDDEEIAKAGTRKEALKILRKKLESKHRQALAKEFDLDKMKTPHKVLYGDLFTLLPKIPAQTYDCIIADPPYGIDADSFNNQSAMQHSYNDSEEYSNEVLHKIAGEGMRITKFKAHAYIFCDINRFQYVKKLFESYGWQVWNTPWIWSKGGHVGVAPRPEHGPRRTFEAIVYCIKNDRKVTDIFPDVLHEPHDKKIQYGAHKPVSLYANLIKRTCLPGNKVIDPCCGTGPVFLAAEETKVTATGIEISEEGYAYSMARIRDLVGGENEEAN